MKAILTRHLSTDEGTPGDFVITDDKGNALRCLSLELPWLNDTPNISCVKVGDYHVAMAYSQKHGKNVYHLQDENGRHAVEIHPYNLAGNAAKGYVAQAEGCIALGKVRMLFKAGTPPAGDKDQWGLGHSAEAVSELEAFTKGADFDLEITYSPEVAQ